MAGNNPQPDLPEHVDFEQALSELDAIVRLLEEGQIGLAEALTRYELGVKLLKQCYLLLEQAERRIELVGRVDPDGQAHLETFDDGALSLEEKAQSRGRRRSRTPGSNTLPGADEIDGSGRLF